MSRRNMEILHLGLLESQKCSILKRRQFIEHVNITIKGIVLRDKKVLFFCQDLLLFIICVSWYLAKYNSLRCLHVDFYPLKQSVTNMLHLFNYILYVGQARVLHNRYLKISLKGHTTTGFMNTVATVIMALHCHHHQCLMICFLLNWCTKLST